MKVAITGHTNGIGQALARHYQQRGHEVMGFSRRTGHNIHLTEKLTNMIEPCDVFVNNAQSGFAQTALLWSVAQRWCGTGKTIVVISTMMAQDPVSVMPGYDMAQYRVQKVALEETVKVYENRKQRIPTSKFNDFMLKLIEAYPPPALKGKYVKIKYCMQLPTPTPQFVFFANLPQYVKEPYKRFLENKIRENWDFSGVPIDIYIREK
jgi:hypothetical protein